MARKKQRENYGNGSVSPEVGKDGKQKRNRNGQLAWRVCISLGKEAYQDESGKIRTRQRKRQRTVYGSLSDARKVAEQLTADYENIDLTDVNNRTFAHACEAWANSMRENDTCAASKLKDYETRLSYVSEKLGKKLLIDITTDDLEKALADVKAEREQSPRTFRDSKRHVKRVFKFAKRKHWIVFDPSEDLEPVSIRGRVERRSLEAGDFARLCACLDRDTKKAIESFEQKEMRQIQWGNGFTRTSIKGLANISCLVGLRILCATGCRRGEMLAIQWGKVDFDSSSIIIDRSLNSDAVLKEPKTDAGIRVLAVDEQTMALLKQWKAFQKRALHFVMVEDENGKKHSIEQSNQTPVVCSCVGGFLNPHNMNRWWNDYRVSIGFDTLKLHELRHTQATQLLGNGMPVIDVAARLGHDDVSVTMNTYGHAIPAHDKMAATLIGQLLYAENDVSGRVVKLDKTA